MKKEIILLVMVLLILPSVFAVNLKIEKQSSNEVLIIGLNQPVIFDLKITNLGTADNLEFYNLLGFETYPKGTVSIGTGETKEIQLKLSPIGEIKTRGFYTMEYRVRGNDGSEQKQEVTFRIIDFKDVFEVGADSINPGSSSINIYIANKVNYNFEDMKVKFSSSFFNIEKRLSLGENKKQTFEVDLNSNDFNKLMAGFYTLTAEVEVDGKKTTAEGTIEFPENNLVVSSHKDYGLVVNTEVIEKANEGNVVVESETVIKKNIISRLFTHFSPEPDVVEKNGFRITYTWSQNIKPGETLKITVKTNWLFPVLIILFVVAIVVFVKKYTKTNLEIKKRISFVNAKGGEFALKVSIVLHAKRYIERVNVLDRLPPLAKLYNKFGGEYPTKIDEKNRKLEWSFEKLEAGETRMLSYVIYSKIGVLGRFALPPATTIFEREGQIKDAVSNRAFFVTEQKGERVDGE